jgi:hypothetical protein
LVALLLDLELHNVVPVQLESTRIKKGTNCIDCDWGFVTSSSGSSRCSACPRGGYAIGTATCATCPSQATSELASSGLSSCICPQGFYGKAYVGEPCSQCDLTYSTCPSNSSKAIISSGFFLNKQSGEVTACTPAQACTSTGEDGGMKCSDRYTGDLCSKCIFGETYRSSGSCIKCPNRAFQWIMIVFFVIIIIFVLYKLLISINRFPLEIKIMVSWIQVIGFFPRLSNSWPIPLAQVLQSIGLTNIDLEVISPDCAANMSFWTKWILQVSFPLVFLGILFLVLTGQELKIDRVFNKEVLRRAYKNWYKTTISTFVLFFAMICILCTAPFACTKRVDGKYALASSPDVLCFDAEWNSHIPAIAFFFLIYLVLVPISIIRTILFSQERTLYEHISWPFKKEFFWWELVVMAQRILISFSINFMTFFLSSIQRSSLVMITVTAYSASISCWNPYKYRSQNLKSLW